MAKYGVILARFQPVHNGHLALIEKACLENDKVILLVGSIDKLNERNPIPWDIRVTMLKEALVEKGLTDRCIIKPLSDLTDETDNSHDWGFYIFAKIVDEIKDSAFTMYYSDGFEIITTWFPGFLLKDHVSLMLLARGKVEEGVSATQVRKLMLEYHTDINKNSDLEKVVPKSVFDRREMLQAFIKIHMNR